MNTKKINPFNRIGLVMALSLVLLSIVAQILQLVLRKIIPGIENSGYEMLIITAIAYYVMLFPFMTLLLKNVPDHEPLDNRKFSIKELIILIIITYGFMQSINMITNIFFTIVSSIMGKQVSNPLVENLSQSAVVANFILTAICAPIFEELFFRGVLLRKLRGYGDTIAIVTTSVLFGLFHQNFSQCFYTIAMGLVLGYVACKSGSVKYSIILHMASNIFGGFVLIFARENPTIIAINLVFIVIIIIAAIILFLLNFKKIKLLKGSVELNNIFLTSCINVGMILYFILCFASMIFSFLLS